MKFKIIITAFFCLLFCCSNSSKPNRNMIKVIFTNWDRSVGAVIGSDSTQMKNIILEDQYLIIGEMIIISPKALEYLIDYFHKYPIDSLTPTNYRRANAIQFIVYQPKEKLNFYIQYNLFNDYIKNFIFYIQMSPYKNECAPLIKVLIKYNLLNQN